MIEKFWEKVGENLAGQLDLRRLGPALAFWVGGLLLWGAQGHLDFLHGVMNLSGIQAGVIIVSALAFVSLSSLAVSALALPMLRLLEGYWTPWPFTSSSWLGRIWLLRYLQSALTKGMQKQWTRLFEKDYQVLAEKYPRFDSFQVQHYAHLDMELLTAYPKQQNLFLPTRTGNVLRAAEEHPQYWYGLQTSLTWPRLWLLLPEPVQKGISEARQTLDQAAVGLVWSILFSAWVSLNGWAVIVAVLAAFANLRQLYAAAKIYGDLIRAAYDLYRFELYRSLSWPLPETPLAERAAGEQITQFLRRRQTPKDFIYHFKEEK